MDLDITFDDAITGDGAPAGYRITSFKGKKQKKDIYHDVQTSGYEYTIRAGKITYFNAEVKALAIPSRDFAWAVEAETRPTGTRARISASTAPASKRLPRGLK